MSEPVVNINPVSILETVKKLLGLVKEYDSFDADIIVHINTVFSTLTQMGIGPVDGFSISGYSQEWSTFITSSALKTQQIKSYVFLKVKMLFDPPSNLNVLNAMNRNLAELEYRLYTQEGGY